MTFLDQLKKLDAEATPGQIAVCNITNAPQARRRDLGTISTQFPHAIDVLIASQLEPNDAELICLLRNNTQAIIDLVSAVQSLGYSIEHFHKTQWDESATLVMVNAELAVKDLAKLKGDV